MLCPACGVELRIIGSATVVTGDDSADTPTRVYTRHTLQCKNPACERIRRPDFTVLLNLI